jgi:hypothetical protein
MYVVGVDPRLCPSPMCGGYWVTLANAARTHCQDGLRHPRCYVATAVSAGRTASIAEGALVRGALDIGRNDLGELVATAVYRPAGATAARGGYYRSGIRAFVASAHRASPTAPRRSTARRRRGRPASTWLPRIPLRTSSPVRRRRCTPRTASTRAAAFPPASTAGVRSTRPGSSSERLCLAPDDSRQSTGTSRFASDPSSDWRNPAAPRTASSAPSASTRVKRRSTSGVNVLAVSR